MKFICKTVTLSGIYSLIFVSQALANGDGSHAPGEMHDDVAKVDPMLIVIPVVVILGGIIIWKVLFNKKHIPPTQTPQTPQPQTEIPKAVQPSSQPEKLEAKK